MGEDNEKTKATVKGKYFYQANVWARIAVVIAGVVMNFLLAVAVFYLFLAVSNFKVLVPKLADYTFISPTQNLIVVTGVAENSPAKTAGLEFGDLIYSVDGNNFATLPEFQRYTTAHVGETVKLELYNQDLTAQKTVKIVPRKNPPKGQGAMGLGIGEGALLNFATPAQKLWSGVTYCLDMLMYSLKVLGGMIFHAAQTGDTSQVSENVSGPVGIGKVVYDILQFGGWEAGKALINLLGLLSVSLAFMNILPIPALDGGRLVFLLVEALFGKKMAAKRENLINQIGMMVLLGLIILVSFNDLKKAFGK